MAGMPIGLITLVVLSILIFFGIGQRALKRLYLSDKSALIVIALMFIGTLLPNIPLVGGISINIGGALIPLILCGHILYRVDTNRERLRALVAIVITSAAVYFASRYLPTEVETIVIEPNYLYATVAGVVAYISGRSRRCAFLAGILSIIINDLLYLFEIYRLGLPSSVVIGGAGVFDTTVIAGIFAVMLAEVIGETRERLSGLRDNQIKNAHSASTLAKIKKRMKKDRINE